ncbi:hypothetical protein AVEN_187874-2 [Araneus ventricosus]|uniref:RNase H type-1 domain-containing protein n=1 Tax=Araneus ventricosus TaxID=182803 RepID=A0A4Y2CTT6_ARAVE|nr:hypothetical protein AVEN_187874-2 [Araneus ventricosus]
MKWCRKDSSLDITPKEEIKRYNIKSAWSPWHGPSFPIHLPGNISPRSYRITEPHPFCSVEEANARQGCVREYLCQRSLVDGRHIGVDHEVHLQWIPSHVDIYGNEVADNLAKQGTAEPLCSTPSLTFDEIYSIRKNKDLKTWRVPPSHDWYKRSSPGGSIGLACDRADQTALSRFVSGHLRSCSFSHGNKVFPVCAKCGVASASPEHILSYLRLSREREGLVTTTTTTT